ncbi:MAG: argininosuccinate synthase, partial [Methanomicrobiales archaeon]|nr:argininosuccinate synthase [Methanomicrobiales archaeon]
MHRHLILGLILCALLAAPVFAAPTTEIRAVAIAPNGTVMAERTVDYRWLEANLPVLGDGVTHYYQQGPVFT